MNAILDTFVQVAQDCPVTVGVVPTTKKNAKPSIHMIQYELLSASPYHYTLEDLIYEVHIRHKEIPVEQVEQHGDRIRAELFQKSHPCMRASMLPKKFGWGVHYDSEGKLALYGMETEPYRDYIAGTSDGPNVVYAMRNKRA
ncbi:hypothetical protein AN963_13915 [Brevibacillus choshinensis]|uniref:Uncharacterized protein n=1 Tax=Brevibacillus choshinensis TaxID=54911 RepID=A0ABR5N623_BRECH|nr:DUF6157 family protein [Brevibacillus choshinensis]KQL46088.1 hypothetical protein AN963_13915 [Brevibacillus choshinensis]